MSEILLTTMTMNEVIRLDATPAFGAYTKFARRRWLCTGSAAWYGARRALVRTATASLAMTVDIHVDTSHGSRAEFWF